MSPRGSALEHRQVVADDDEVVVERQLVGRESLRTAGR